MRYIMFEIVTSPFGVYVEKDGEVVNGFFGANATDKAKAFVAAFTEEADETFAEWSKVSFPL
jgi:hypothetical protein